ncbi:MAG: DNA adenine methylase [Candidatus Porifericomitaceae bacterium WSBS_2022_MAG_OTU9]
MRLADAYESMWLEQADSRLYFAKVRDEFNNSPKPELMLYLLARIVKGSIRYNSDGRFNQSPDNRRLGMHPDKMRANIMRVSALLAGKAVLSSVDYRAVLAGVGEDDLVYMDPPYQGTSSTRDGRYLRGLAYLELVESLESMNDRGISYVVSYDGHTGGNAHGKMLPRKLAPVGMPMSMPAGQVKRPFWAEIAPPTSLCISPAPLPTGWPGSRRWWLASLLCLAPALVLLLP